MSENKIIEIEKFIICDEVRIEKSGKLIFIGVYPDDVIMVHQDLPYIHKSLALFLMLKVKQKGEKILNFELIDPKGNILFKPDNPLKSKSNKVSINTEISNFEISCSGEYKMLVYLDNNKVISLSFWIKRFDNKETL